MSTAVVTHNVYCPPGILCITCSIAVTMCCTSGTWGCWGKAAACMCAGVWHLMNVSGTHLFSAEDVRSWHCMILLFLYWSICVLAAEHQAHTQRQQGHPRCSHCRDGLCSMLAHMLVCARHWQCIVVTHVGCTRHLHEHMARFAACVGCPCCMLWALCGTQASTVQQPASEIMWAT